MAQDLSKDQLALLKQAFQAFDQQQRGCIPCETVGTILDMMGHPQDDAALKEIIEEVDADGSGELEFDEFCDLAARFIGDEEEAEDAGAMQEDLREAFRLYDYEGNGYITTDVLREILSELDERMSEEELDEMIADIDSDGSGTVDFEEFCAALR
ncbi:troponin C, isoallergen Bla g 6.0101 isoform X2 [Bemisia tabaci]|uniref:troponin C, isoallergen Bla g 6.0101 isoform X2 n=1 Tax=Bemisia tabaci TaxID=7038 RepID=UPI0008F9ADCA|nr:PREDICTED: troponin C-like isoform X2 [Bemisia tabaci]